jgi:hypothetical protein
MPACKLCENEVAALTRAHVIPKSFFEIGPRSAAPRLVTNSKGVYPKKTPIGIYDQTIVCAECERRFDRCDDYAAKLLLHSPGKFVRQPGGFLIPKYDYHLLKMFIVAVLWRASASTHPFFSRINIGSHFEPRARKMLLDDDPGDPQEFGAILSIWAGAELPLLMDPFREKIFGVRTYRFYLGRYVAYVKVDGRAFPEAMTPGLLRPNQPLDLISRDFSTSKEFRLARRIRDVNEPYLRKAFR